MTLAEWIDRFIDNYPNQDYISRLDVELLNILLPTLMVTDGKDGPMMALGISLALAHVAKHGIPTDLSDWFEEA